MSGLRKWFSPFANEKKVTLLPGHPEQVPRVREEFLKKKKINGYEITH